MFRHSSCPFFPRNTDGPPESPDVPEPAVAAKEYFERTRPDWFLVEYLPSYAPELNPVEQCWHYMKNVAMVNFVPMCRKQLEAKAEEAVQAINSDPILLPPSSITQN